MERSKRGRKPEPITGGREAALSRAKILHEIRNILLITQEEMAKILGYSRASDISKMENAEERRWINDKKFIEIVGKLRNKEKLNPDPGTFKKLQDYLDKIRLPKPTITKEVQYECPVTRWELVGRKKEKSYLLKRLSRDSKSSVVKIYGINGIGKSALAIDVAERCRKASEHFKEPYFDAIFWYSRPMNGSESKEEDEKSIKIPNNNLKRLLKRIIEFLKPEKSEKMPKGEKLVELAKTLLTQFGTLLIIDNIGKYVDQQVKNFIDTIPFPSKVLIIDRFYCFRCPSQILLPELSTEESIATIKKICYENKIDLDEQKERQIADMTGGIPFAMKRIIENICKIGTLSVDWKDCFCNRNYTFLKCIFKDTYDQLSVNAKILLSTISLLPVAVAGEFLYQSNSIFDSKETELIQLLKYRLIKKTGPSDSDLLIQTYSISPLLSIFISHQEDHDVEKIIQNILNHIISQLTEKAAHYLFNKDSSRIQEYINNNSELLSWAIVGMEKMPRFREIKDLVPGIEYPKGLFQKIKEESKNHCVTYDPTSKQWIEVLPQLKTSDEQ